MSLAEVRKVLGDQKAKLYGNEPVVPLEECAYLESRALKKGLGLMFARGLVVRIDIEGPDFRTASGAGIGDTKERIQRLYRGRIRVERHHYLPDGHYLEYRPVDPADRCYGITFETDGKLVTSFRVGTIEAIALVEGCS